MYRPRNRSSAFPSTKQEEQEAKEVQNARAIQVLGRVKEKLTGTDFAQKEGKDKSGASGSVMPPMPGMLNGAGPGQQQQQVPNGGVAVEGEMRVDLQVDRLIREATNLENLCQHYIGWCSFW